MATQRKINHCYTPSACWTCIGHPDDPFKTLVDEQGSLLYEFVNSIPAEGEYWFNRVFSFGLKNTASPIRIQQLTESARHPFVKTRIEYPDLILDLLAFAHEENGKRSDIVLWSVVPATHRTTADTALWIDGQALGKVFVLPEGISAGQRVSSIDATCWHHEPTVMSMAPSTESGKKANRELARTLAFVSTPHEVVSASGSQYGPCPRLQTSVFTTTSSEPVQGAFIFPLNHGGDDHYDLAWANQALVRERKFWDEFPLQSGTWQLPDDDVTDMVTACARNIVQARDIKDGLPEFQVGPTCYRDLWVVDGHFILEAARYLGHDSAGNQGIAALLRRVKPDGSITQMPFHSKETGISIATLVRQCEISDDWDRLETLWPVIRNAVQHIRDLREEARARGKSAPDYNLMPPSFADGGLGGGRPEYTTTLWTLAGLKKAVTAAHHLGYVDDAAAFEAEFQDLLSVFREKAERDMQYLPDGTPYLPMSMPGASSDHIHDQDHEGDVSPYYRINPGTATWALAHAIYPGEVFAPDDPIVANFCALLDLIDDEEGVPANTGWLPHNAVWNYSASFYAHVWLYADRPDKAVDYLYDFANHSGPTRVWREEQSLRSATIEQFVGDMPHNWASAEFIRLTRHLLIFEKGEGLELLKGVPPEWIKSGQTLRLEGTQTRFGSVNVVLTIDNDYSATLCLEFEMNRSLKPESVTLHLPEPFGSVRTEKGMLANVDEQKVQIPFIERQVLQLFKTGL